MRRQFHPLLLDHMRRDPRIVLVTADLGYRMLDAIFEEFPDRAYNCGAAEQLMLGIAVGLAEDGMIPVTYTISPFYWRAAEWIRNFVNHEKVPVKMCLGGRDKDYAEDGFTHDASDIQDLFSQFQSIQGYWPQSVDDLPSMTEAWLTRPGPAYLNLKR